MRRSPIDKESIRFPDLVRQIAVNDTVYGWKFKLETRRDRPLDRTTPRHFGYLEAAPPHRRPHASIYARSFLSWRVQNVPGPL